MTQEQQVRADQILTEILKDLLNQKRWTFGIPPKGPINKKATGNLINSVKIMNAQFNQEMTVMTFDIDGPRNPYPYFSIVDRGRRKGAQQPPIEPILNWINKRGINIRNEKGQFISGSIQNNAKKKLSLAYAISGGIKKKGIRGNNVIVVFDDEIYASQKFFDLYREIFGDQLTETIDKVKLD